MGTTPQTPSIAVSAESAGIELGPDASRVVFPDQYFQNLFVKGVRTDGRRLDESRDIELQISDAYDLIAISDRKITIEQMNVVSSRPASCTTRIGNTTVMAAASCQLVRPNDETPSHGILDISFEIPPGCSNDLRPGQTVEEAQVISSQLQRIFSKSPCPVLDMEALCIVEKQHCWKIQIEAVCIDNDGGLLCASIAACIGALRSLKRPAVKIHKSEDMTEADGSTRARVQLIKDEFSDFQLSCFPIPETIAYYRAAEGNKMFCLLSPTIEEERVAHSKITVVIAAGTDDLLFVNGTGPGLLLSPDILRECVQKTRQRTELLKEAIEKAVKENQ